MQFKLRSIENSDLSQASFYGADTEGLSMTNIFLNNGCGDVEDLDGFECVQNGEPMTSLEVAVTVLIGRNVQTFCSWALLRDHQIWRCWFAENLKTTTFSNGSITNFSDGLQAYGSYNSYGDCEFWYSDESGYCKQMEIAGIADTQATTATSFGAAKGLRVQFLKDMILMSGQRLQD